MNVICPVTFWLSVTVSSVMRLTFQIRFTWPKGPTTPHFYAYQSHLCLRFLSTFTSTLSLLFCTTPNLNRPDSSLVCLGWICCCSPLPLSMPMVLNITQVAVMAIITPPLSHNIHLKQTWHVICLSWLDFLLYPATPSPCLWTSSSPLSLPKPFCTTVRQTQTSLLHDPGCVICHLLHLVHVHLLMYTASGWHAPALHIAGWSHLPSFMLSTVHLFMFTTSGWHVCPSWLEPLLFPTVSAYPSLRPTLHVDIKSFRLLHCYHPTTSTQLPSHADLTCHLSILVGTPSPRLLPPLHVCSRCTPRTFHLSSFTFGTWSFTHLDIVWLTCILVICNVFSITALHMLGSSWWLASRPCHSGRKCWHYPMPPSSTPGCCHDGQLVGWAWMDTLPPAISWWVPLSHLALTPVKACCLRHPYKPCSQRNVAGPSQ